MAVLGSHAPAAVGPTAFQNWGSAGSFFFATTIVTTIGYGSFSPSTDGGKIFLIFYSLIGITATGPIFGVIGDFILKGVRRCFSCKEPSDRVNASSLKLCFNKYDADHSGCLDKREIEMALEDMQVNCLPSLTACPLNLCLPDVCLSQLTLTRRRRRCMTRR